MSSSRNGLRRTADRAERQQVNVVDLFSGCGGMSCGFHKARTRTVRFRCRGALDTDRHANATFARMLGVKPLEWDVCELLRPKRLEAAKEEWRIEDGSPLLLIGCAPCQGFSSHQKRWGGQDDRNSLLSTFARVVTRLLPDIVVMENVPEVFHERHWDHFAKWRASVRRAGYVVRARIYSLAQFGVPQDRFRALIIASRIWENFAMPRPKLTPRNYVTVRQAISHLRELRAGGCDPDDPMHITSRHRSDTVDLIKQIPSDGGSQRDLPDGVGPGCLRRVDGFRDVYGRMFWDRPANAVTTRCRTPSAGRYTHPEQHRGLSVREAALLQGFPPDYYFEGPFDDRFKQIGNAVSPIFAQEIAKHLDKQWRSGGQTDPDDLHLDIATPITKSISSMLASIKRRQRANDNSMMLFSEAL